MPSVTRKPASPSPSRAKKKSLPSSAKARPAASRKRAAKPAPAGAAAADAADIVYTLEGLAAQVKTPVSEADVRVRVTASPQDLIAVGSSIGTERIDTDCARIYGGMLSFYRGATQPQRRVLVGCSLRLIEVAIWAAHHGHGLWTQRDTGLRAKAGGQQLRAASGEKVRAQAKARRQQLKEALDGVAGGEHEALSAIAADYGSIDTVEHFADSLNRLAARGRRYLSNRDPGVLIRLRDTQLDEPYLAETEALAAQVLLVSTAARASRERPAVTQDEVDLWDGINLALLERLLRVFEAGRAADPTIPHFAVLSLRGWWLGYRKSQPSPAPSPVPGPGPDPVSPTPA